MPARPVLVVFLGGLGESAIEGEVARVRVAATLDSLDTALATGLFEGAVLATDGSVDAGALPEGAALDERSGAFHFGERLAELVERCGLERIVYLGGGSLPLLTKADYRAIVETAADGAAVTNNQFSSDLVAFPASALARIRPPESDNRLARALAEEADLELRVLDRTLATLFDIDGPADPAVLALAGLGGPRLREALVSLDLDLARYERLLPLFTDRCAQITVAGRVGSHAWRYLERETACRVRLFAEERGMEADGRAERGEARSLIGMRLAEVGPERFMRDLAELGDAAVFDTRVLLAHFRIEASRADRFLSDAGRWREIGEPFLRDLTRAAVEAPLPVLLGGHSLVSGGLMALNELAWQRQDAAAP